MFDGQSFSAESFSADAWFGLLAQTPAPQYQRIGGAIRHQNRKRRRIPPDEEIDLKKLQLAAASIQVRPRAIRRREEEVLLS